jgi:KUP system potassium uptake protein
MDMARSSGRRHSLGILALSALGVVFGDIGTSPLYAFRECFAPEHLLPLNPANILGILSLIFWTLFFVVTLKYMAVVMRADNKGEGGILSLMAMASSTFKLEGEAFKKWCLVALGLIGAALLYGDGVITPAISVLSAVEGLKVVTPVFEPFIIPVTILLISLLFLFQRFGTGNIGFFFGPIILCWFVAIGVLGAVWIIKVPEVLHALNPILAIQFFIDNGIEGLFVLGSVVLVVMGGEALYADMGHFGRNPIRLAWFFVAMPGLLLNYFGQGALLLENPNAISNPFYLMAPSWALSPMVVLATAATVIASQARATSRSSRAARSAWT